MTMDHYHYVIFSVLMTGQIFENWKVIKIILLFHKGGSLSIYIKPILSTASECWENISKC